LLRTRRAKADGIITLMLAAARAVLDGELILVGSAARLEGGGRGRVHRLERELAIDTLAEGSQLEVVGRVQRRADRHIVVDELEEFLFEELRPCSAGREREGEGGRGVSVTWGESSRAQDGGRPAARSTEVQVQVRRVGAGVGARALGRAFETPSGEASAR
jgi:hypothetical protein